jgi:Ca2+-transporting ATPase
MVDLGLTSNEAEERLQKFGLNELPRTQLTPLTVIFIRQFVNLFSLLLIIASLLSLLQRDIADTILIVSILVLNAGLGFWQEFKASREMQSLQSFSVATSRVFRGGKEVELESRYLVPGDVFLLEAGSRVPADGRIIEAHAFSVDESALTGESTSEYKSAHSERNQLFLSSIVLTGKAYVEVTETGQNTKFGITVEYLIAVEDEQTPLEKSLNSLAKSIGYFVLAVAIGIFLFDLYKGYNLVTSFFTSIALLVAAVPEGLPTIITVVLALGVRKLYHKKTLVRKMSAVESLGATKVICTDKTGTLTYNEMTVRRVILADAKHQKQFERTAVICNNASIVLEEGKTKYDVLGDTTEGALLLWAEKEGIDYESIKQSAKVVDELPFDPEKRMMATLTQENDAYMLYVKGAPESIVEHCSLSNSEKEKVLEQTKQLAMHGLRVLALAYKHTDEKKISIEKLEYAGMVGIADSPREEVEAALKKARAAKIEVVMVTGDNELTAKAIADEIGLLREGEEIITGDQLDTMSEEELTNKLDRIRIYARTTPEHKIRIVSAFQAQGKVVAVTGDGVNDSLALKKANVGIAMGECGTDVAKEASDIILLNDDFSTIVTAVEQGRVIYSNIINVVRFLLTGNFSEILVVAGLVLMGYPNPLLPVQLLWINFVTDGLPALSLSAGKGSFGLMRKAPRSNSEPILSKYTITFIAIAGVVIAVINIVIFVILYHIVSFELAREVLFSTIVITQMIFVLVVAGERNLLANKYLTGSILLVLTLQLLVTTLPGVKELFNH